VNDGMHADKVELQPRRAGDDSKHASGSPGAHGPLTETEELGSDGRSDLPLLSQDSVGHVKEPAAPLVILIEAVGHILDHFYPLEQPADPGLPQQRLSW
jgi:hypothetical protein